MYYFLCLNRILKLNSKWNLKKKKTEFKYIFIIIWSKFMFIIKDMRYGKWGTISRVSLKNCIKSIYIVYFGEPLSVTTKIRHITTTVYNKVIWQSFFSIRNNLIQSAIDRTNLFSYNRLTKTNKIYWRIYAWYGLYLYKYALAYVITYIHTCSNFD